MFISKSDFKKRLWQAEHNGYLKGLELAEKCQELGDVLYQLSIPIEPTIPMPSSFRKFIEEEL